MQSGATTNASVVQQARDGRLQGRMNAILDHSYMKPVTGQEQPCTWRAREEMWEVAYCHACGAALNSGYSAAHDHNHKQHHHHTIIIINNIIIITAASPSPSQPVEKQLGGEQRHELDHTPGRHQRKKPRCSTNNGECQSASKRTRFIPDMFQFRKISCAGSPKLTLNM